MIAFFVSPENKSFWETLDIHIFVHGRGSAVIAKENQIIT